MIDVSLAWMVLLPLTFNLALLLLWWIFYSVRDAARRVPVSRTRLYRCAICSRVYVDDRELPLAKCPQCGCLNQAVRR